MKIYNCYRNKTNKRKRKVKMCLVGGIRTPAQETLGILGFLDLLALHWAVHAHTK